MTSSNGNNFRVTGPLWGKSTGHRWIPLTEASDAELWCFLWSAPEQRVEQAIALLVIWYAIELILTSLYCLQSPDMSSDLKKMPTRLRSFYVVTVKNLSNVPITFCMIASWPVKLGWKTCHQMETFSALLSLCVGKPPVTGEFPSKMSVTLSFDVFFDQRLNKSLSKQSGSRWFETPLRTLYDVTVLFAVPRH